MTETWSPASNFTLAYWCQKCGAIYYDAPCQVHSEAPTEAPNEASNTTH